MREDVSEGQIGDENEREEERGGGWGLALGPREMEDGWVVHKPVLEG